MTPGRAGYTRQPGHLLLAQSPRLAELLDVPAEPESEVVGHAQTIAPCQSFGKNDRAMARPPYVRVENGGSMEIKGRAVLITGAGRGLGRALAQRFARAGARVVLVARGRNELEAVAEDIRREGGVGFAVTGDLGAKEDIHRIAGVATALVGPLDIVVNNASTLGPVPLRTLHDTAC